MQQVLFTNDEYKDLQELLKELLELRPDRKDVIALIERKLNQAEYKRHPWDRGKVR